MELMQKPSVIDSPSGGALEKAPRWYLTGTEGCGGGNRVSWYSWMFLGYMDIYRRKKQVGGAASGPRGWGACLPPWARPPTSWPPCGFLDVHSKSPGLRLFQKRSSRRFHSVWILFGFRLILLFCETLKQAKNSNLHWALGQQVSPKNNIKVYK